MECTTQLVTTGFNWSRKHWPPLDSQKHHNKYWEKITVRIRGAFYFMASAAFYPSFSEYAEWETKWTFLMATKPFSGQDNAWLYIFSSPILCFFNRHLLKTLFLRFCHISPFIHVHWWQCQSTRSIRGEGALPTKRESDWPEWTTHCTPSHRLCRVHIKSPKKTLKRGAPCSYIYIYSPGLPKELSKHSMTWAVCLYTIKTLFKIQLQRYLP